MSQITARPANPRSGREGSGDVIAGFLMGEREAVGGLLLASTRAYSPGKLPFRYNLRHRDCMAPFRYRDEGESLGGALAKIGIGAATGFVVGVIMAQKIGGISGLSSRLRDKIAGLRGDDLDDIRVARGLTDESLDTELEERVLEAFRNDPILSERGIDIGSIGEGTIELTGWVETTDESERATTITRGVPGVETVVNRIIVGEEEEMLDDNARRHAEGDPGMNEGHWEGQRVGTGRRRQGNSEELDRHADPKPELEDRWLAEQHALEQAADDTPDRGVRKASARKARRGGRADGSPVAPTGVPKADHVADPLGVEEPPRAD